MSAQLTFTHLYFLSKIIPVTKTYSFIHSFLIKYIQMTKQSKALTHVNLEGNKFNNDMTNTFTC